MKNISPVDTGGVVHIGAWKPIDLTSIDAVTVDNDATASQIFEKMRFMVEESTRKLYGDNNDPKLKNLIAAVMLRVRAAMNELIDNYNAGAIASNEKLVESFEQWKAEFEERMKFINAKEFVYIKRSDYDELLKSLKASGEDAIEAEYTVIDKKKKDEDYAKQQIDASNKPASSDSGQAQTTQPAQAESTQPAVVQQPRNDIEQPAEAQPLNTPDEDTTKQLSKYFESMFSSQPMEQMLANVGLTFTSLVDLMASSPYQIESNLNQMMLPLSSTQGESASQTKRKLNQVQRTAELVERAQQQTMNPQIDLYKSKESFGIFTSRQFLLVMRYLKTTWFANRGVIKSGFDQTAAQIKNVDSSVKQVNEKLNTSKFPWMTIILLASAVLIPMFWDKVKEFLATINEKFNITKAIDKLIASIDWNRHFDTVVNALKKYLVQRLGLWITDPWQAICQSLKNIWNSIVKWKNDIYAWAMGQRGNTIDIIEREENNNQKFIQDNISTLQKKLTAHSNDQMNRLDSSLSYMDKMNESNVLDLQKYFEDGHNGIADGITNSLSGVQKSIDIASADSIKGVDAASKKASDTIEKTLHGFETTQSQMLDKVRDEFDAKTAFAAARMETIATVMEFDPKNYEQLGDKVKLLKDIDEGKVDALAQLDVENQPDWLKNLREQVKEQKTVDARQMTPEQAKVWEQTLQYDGIDYKAPWGSHYMSVPKHDGSGYDIKILTPDGKQSLDAEDMKLLNDMRRRAKDGINEKENDFSQFFMKPDGSIGPLSTSKPAETIKAVDSNDKPVVDASSSTSRLQEQPVALDDVMKIETANQQQLANGIDTLGFMRNYLTNSSHTNATLLASINSRLDNMKVKQPGNNVVLFTGSTSGINSACMPL